MIRKVKAMIKLLEEDGWVLKDIKGSHRQFKHPTKPGKVTINGKLSDDLGHELVNSIEKQAGLR
jgi:predicted RNA binding protein YcfA (HicA-like mRNA interferase family)